MARDYDALTALKALLAATGKFDVIARYTAAEYTPAGDAATFAFLAPGTGILADAADVASDGSGHDLVEAHEFEMTLVVSDADPERRTERLCLLRSVAEKAIVGSSLNGTVMPAFTLLSRWRYVPSRPPFKACVCTVQTQILLAGADAADVTDAIDFLA